MISKWGREIVLVITIIGLGVIAEAVNPNFTSFRNISSILGNTAVMVLVVIGESFVIINGFGNADLSVGSIYTISAVTSAQFAVMGAPMFLVVLWSIGIGLALGALNGFITAKFRIPSLITTLGTMIGLEGFILWWTNGMWIYNLPNKWQISNYPVLGISLDIWIGFGVSILMVFFVRNMPLFRKFYACGTNIEAAIFAGINPNRTIFYALMLSGMFSGFSGFLSASRFFVVSSNIGSNLVLPVIAAAVIGGTSILGGRGKVEGNILGAILLTEISSVTIFLGIPATWSEAIEGLIILLAIISDVLRENRRKRGVLKI
ncbi:ABC transporter permease [Athalassotoga saccharophila]|uniref:ABC transporter permease n=1 Tax=Athalassotoga saccharophila TaxID=1441386 RepID=UPI00137ACDE6|nr:ABC transporter permease [Athalassotoga saccharophila]BBJ27378.1 ribose ABC transport system, permease protein RbsC [Athalassotoga saccharophila]